MGRSEPRSVPDVCEVSVRDPIGDARGWLLVEVPHGATRTADYNRVAARLKSPLPPDLIHFFYVNTDIGAPEAASWLESELPRRGIGVVFVRCLFPRTFIDPNRVIPTERSSGAVVDGITPGLAPYITHPDDVAYLTELHRQYHAVVDRAYEVVCDERSGLALALHSFAPRSVGIETVDDRIVEALHAAYEPSVYATWPERPPIDLICSLPDGSFHAAPSLHDALVHEYERDGIAAKKNETYALHPSTMGYLYAQRYPSQVLCVELNRGLVASPFVPFGESPIDAAKVERMTAPIARVARAHFG